MSLLDDGLGDVVNVVVNGLVNLLAKVDDGALFWCMNFSVLVLGGQAGEELVVLRGGSVLLVDLGLRHDVLALYTDDAISRKISKFIQIGSRGPPEPRSCAGRAERDAEPRWYTGISARRKIAKIKYERGERGARPRVASQLPQPPGE